MDWNPFLGLPLWVWLFVVPTALCILFYLLRETARVFLRPVWALLNFLYNVSGVLAAVFMVMILLIIVAQMIARWAGVSFQGSTEFAGYAMAATSFFALAHALNRGAHIRVSILLNLNRHTRKWLDAFAMFMAAITATYFARYAIKTNFMSHILNDRTQGQDQLPESMLALLSMLAVAPSEWGAIWSNAGSGWVYTPVWVPQLVMSVGTTLLAIALWDNLIRLLVNGETSIKAESIK